MNQNTDIQTELTELGCSLTYPAVPLPMQVPENYFNKFPELMLQRVQDDTELSVTFLQTLPKSTPYTVPAGYFTQLADQVLAIAKTEDTLTAREEIAAISPLLSGIHKEMPYSVPENFFQQSVQPPVQENKPAKGRVVSFGSSGNWMRYAVAAVIIGFFAISGLFYLNRPAAIDPVKNPEAWVKKNTKKISTDELASFIELTDLETAALQPSSMNPVKANEIRQLMEDVTDKDIQQFLNETSVNGDPENDILLN